MQESLAHLVRTVNACRGRVPSLKVLKEYLKNISHADLLDSWLTGALMIKLLVVNHRNAELSVSNLLRA